MIVFADLESNLLILSCRLLRHRRVSPQTPKLHITPCILTLTLILSSSPLPSPRLSSSLLLPPLPPSLLYLPLLSSPLLSSPLSFPLLASRFSLRPARTEATPKETPKSRWVASCTRWAGNEVIISSVPRSFSGRGGKS